MRGVPQYLLWLSVVVSVAIPLSCLASKIGIGEKEWALDIAHAPADLLPPDQPRPVTIAIIDDGVRITHKDLADFIWENPGEIPGNHIDDDGNGYIDDYHGWDLADNNNQVAPPANRLEQYSHGTQIAGIIARIAGHAYGKAATNLLKMMPVKSMSDEADRLVISEGFKGIRYAMNNGADIIVCAWGINHISPDERRILEEARDKGILIIASSGNAFQETDQYPAAHPAVLAVAAMTQAGLKTDTSSYGQFVDILAPGSGLTVASAISDSSHDILEGTSFAAGLTAAAASLVSIANPDYSASWINACLQTSTDAFDQQTAAFLGKQGSGKLNIAAAIQCRELLESRNLKTALVKSRGYLRLNSNGSGQNSWLIKPQGVFKGIRFRPAGLNWTSTEGTLNFYSDQSDSARLLASYKLNAIPESIYIPATSVYVVFNTENQGTDQLLAYEIETIDFSTLYCQGTRKIDEEGFIEDGSGLNDYSPGSDCKWLITAPNGQVVQFEFVEFDTEAKTDFIYFFDGAGSHDTIMARFSGPDIPPRLTTWHNQVLMWFVTNGNIQGPGWKVKLHFQPEK